MKYQAKFYLKDAKSEQETPINVHFWCNRKRFKVATGLKVHPKQWDSVKYRARRGATFHAIINDRLEELELLMANLYEGLRRSGREITPAALKELFDRATKRSSTEKETLLLLDRYRKFIDDSHDRLQPGTIKGHTASLHHLQSFEAMTGMRYSYENVTMQFFNALVSYLVGKARLSNDSAWRVIKDFRAFLQHSIEQGHTANAEFKGFTKKRMPQGEKTDQVYLTLEELDAVMTKDFSNDSRLDRSRDLFVFQAHVGLRYGDLALLSEVHFQKDRIRLVTQKNRKSISIPVLPPVRVIWEKYDGKLPVITNQKQNEYLKEVMKEAGITTPVLTVNYRGAERIENVQPKYELIGTHTAKRTFVTILRRRGVSVESIMKITGNTRKTIETYILTTEDDAAREIEAAWV